MLIGISGKKESGKSTSAKVLSKFFKQYYTQVEIRSFADPLKDALAIMLGINRTNLDDSGFKKQDSFIPKPTGGFYTYRELMQLFGTNVARVIHNDFWVLCTASNHSDKVIIIDDVRFPNEASFIKEQGGCVIRLNKIPSPFDIIDTHESEVALDSYNEFNYVLNNDSTMSELESKLYDIAKSLKVNINIY